MRKSVVRGPAALVLSGLLAACQASTSERLPVDATVIETATANGYVSSADPRTAYPSSTKLYVGSGGTVYRTYLKFDLTDRAGRLTSASLELHTGDGGGGSAASQKVSVTSSKWVEPTLTYKAAPGAEALAGTLAGPTKPDTTYSVPLSTAALQSAVGGTLSLVVEQTSSDEQTASDDLVLSSRDSPTPPWLALTFDGTAPPPTGSPTTPHPRSTEAAVLHGWGKPIAGDEFNYTGPPKESKWSVYDSPGHKGNGVRSPAQVRVNGSVLRITGDAHGTTGGMSQDFDQTYGKWEARMRVSPARDVKYHPVMIVWPEQGRVPENGCAEMDYAESTKIVNQANFIVHHSCSGTARVRTMLDMTEWHNYAIYWSAGAVRGYIDGEQIFETTDASEIPDDPAHQTIQLDWFPDGTPTVPTWMEVDWVRVYR